MSKNSPKPKNESLERILPYYEASYAELVKCARRIKARYVYLETPTEGLVSGAFVRLADVHHPKVNSPEHLLRLMATTMRYVVVDQLRKHTSLKRGGQMRAIPLENLEQMDAGAVTLDGIGFLELHEAATVFGERHEEMGPIIEGFITQIAPTNELAEIYGTTRGKVEAAIRLFAHFLKRQGW